MMRTFVFAAVAVAVSVAVTPAQGRGVAGLTRQTWTIGGVERSALISAPSGRAAGKDSPLVRVFHGHGGTSTQAARTFRIHDAWPEAVVIYPQGLPTVGQVTDPEGRRPGWQHTPGGEGDRDLKLVDAILAWAKEKFAIDPAQVFAAGHSNGGSMVYVLWAARADQFAAFAPSSSVFRVGLIKSARPKPAFIVAGKQDALVPFAAQQLSLAVVLRLNQAPRDGQKWEGDTVRHAGSDQGQTRVRPGSDQGRSGVRAWSDPGLTPV